MSVRDKPADEKVHQLLSHAMAEAKRLRERRMAMSNEDPHAAEYSGAILFYEAVANSLSSVAVAESGTIDGYVAACFAFADKISPS